MKTFIGPVLAVVLMTGCATRPVQGPGNPTESLRIEHPLTVGEIRLAPAVAGTLSDADQAELLKQLREAANEGMPAGHRAGAGDARALRVDLLVTSLDEVRPGVNALTTLLLFVPMDMGGIEFEARFYDPQGAEMAVMKHRDRSTPLNLKGSFNRFGHARNALRAWVKEIASEA